MHNLSIHEKQLYDFSKLSNEKKECLNLKRKGKGKQIVQRK